MTSDALQSYAVELVNAIVPAMARAHAALLEFNRTWKKASRGRRAAAKRLARALRHGMVHAAGCTFRGDARWAPCATIDTAQECVNDYLAKCRELGVVPPVVRVPRSLRRRFGRTIGGYAETWDTDSLPDLVTP